MTEFFVFECTVPLKHIHWAVIIAPVMLCLANPTNNLSFSTPWGLDWWSLDYRSCIATVLAKDLNIYILKPLFLKLSVMTLHCVQTDPTNGNTSNILHLAVVLRMLEHNRHVHTDPTMFTLKKVSEREKFMD